MSERGPGAEAGARGPALPPAAFDITRYRRAAELADERPRFVPLLFVVFLVAAVTILALLVAAVSAGSSRSARGSAAVADPVALVALGVVGLGVLLALLVILPAQIAGRRRRARRREADVFRMAAASGLSDHLASIGYAAPTLVTAEWVTSPDSTAVVPLVHDSVIASRWWRPSAEDRRVFVEPYLRRGETLSSLPALPPLER
ncbi:MAG: hypothetical protein RI885_1788 [Actinomycetota bacterium]|jgi:hypothetical protein